MRTLILSFFLPLLPVAAAPVPAGETAIAESIDRAESLRAGAKYNEALTILRAALRQTSDHSDHALAATALNIMGNVYQDLGSCEESIASYERALTIWKRIATPGSHGPSLAASGLVSVNIQCGNLRRASRIYNRFLSHAELPDPPNDVAGAKILESRAELLMARRHYREAESAYQRVLAAWEKLSGPRHADVGITLACLGILYGQTRNLDKALDYGLRSLFVLESALGSGHPLVARQLGNLAAIHYLHGDSAQAEAEYARASSIAEEALGPANGLLFVILKNHAGMLKQMKRKNEARDLERRASAVQASAFLGAGHNTVDLSEMMPVRRGR